MLERMYAPVSPSVQSFSAFLNVGNGSVGVGIGLKRSGSNRSVTTLSSHGEEETREECTVDEEDMKARYTSLSPSPPRKGKRPLSLSPSSPSISLTPAQYSSQSKERDTRILLSSPPSRTRTPPLSSSHINSNQKHTTRPQSLLVTSSDTSYSLSGSHPRQRISYSTSSMNDIWSSPQSQSRSPSISSSPTLRNSLTPSSSPTRRPSSMISSSSTAFAPGLAQNSLSASSLTRFTSLPSRVGGVVGGIGGMNRGRRKSLSSLRPWSVDGAFSSELNREGDGEERPSTSPASPSKGMTTLESTSTSTTNTKSQQAQRTAPPSLLPHLQPLEPRPIPIPELMELKRVAKGEIRHTAGCLLGLRFLSSEGDTMGRNGNGGNGWDWTRLVERVESFIRPYTSTSLSSSSNLNANDDYLCPPTPIRHPSEISIINSSLDSYSDEDSETASLVDFEQAYDPAYWEDVRSVLGLLISALEGGTRRVKEVVGEGVFPPTPSAVGDVKGKEAAVSESEMKLEVPEPVVMMDNETSPTLTPASAQSTSGPLLDLPNSDTKDEIQRTNELLAVLKSSSGKSNSGAGGGFAPMPTHLNRFVRHMEAMQEAVGEAEDALRECVELLSSSSSTSSTDPATFNSNVDKQSHFAIYDRLRSALGVALRECERGRQPLIDHLTPPPPPSKTRFGYGYNFGFGLDESIPEEDSDHLRESMPPLVHDHEHDHDHDDERSSTESISRAMSPPPQALTHSDPMATIVEGNLLPEREGAPTLQQLLEHALMNIPEGREQVFEGAPAPESESAAGIEFDRRKSQMSREERIKLVRARRAAGDPPVPSTGGKPVEVKKKKSRPGLDVVQELKDVIWQVGERRRRLGRSASSSTGTAPSTGTDARRARTLSSLSIGSANKSG